MKRLILIALFPGLLFIFTSSTNNEVSVPLVHKEHTILLKLVPGILPEESYKQEVSSITESSLRKVLQKFAVTSLRSVFKNRYTKAGKLKESVKGKNLLTGWFELSLRSQFEVIELIKQFKQLSMVIDAGVDAPISLRPSIAPNDTNYMSQWHLNHPFTPNFDINAESAWDINRGRNDVIVAVLDGGVDYTHSDLDPGNRSRVISGIDTGDGDNDPMDDLPDNHPESFAGHGTNVAGVIGARTNNGQLVAGVMWNCSIMPVKMVRSGSIRFPFSLNWDWSTTAFPSDVADAIDFAIANGAHIINLSYGFADMGWPLDEIASRIPLLYEAIDNAYQNNVVITASMGNEYEEGNPVIYPAGFREQVIAVGATDETGTRVNFSNTGSHISLSAPGTGIATTARGGGMAIVSGTSFSAPIVAGVAGLVISQGKDRGFNLTNDDVRHILESTANGQVGPNIGFDNETGHGIVNANNALQLLNQPNVLYHYNSIGGTSTFVQNFTQWTLLSNRWGLAAGAYYNVDQYKISKHINFDTPFCSTPKVWLRARQSKSLNYGSPNSGISDAFITNITTTGFDLEYVMYYVRTNGSSQTLNTWIPVAPASTNVAYTVVGVPVGPISGPAYVCSSGANFTLGIVPAGAPVTWQASPSNLFTTSSGSFTGSGNSHTITLTAASTNSSGQGTLTINVACGTSTQFTTTFWVGVPSITNPTVNTNAYYTNYPVCPGANFLNVTPMGTPYVAGWVVPPGISYAAGYNLLDFTMPSNLNSLTISATSGNYCGNSKAFNFKLVKKTTGCNQALMATVYPNPAADELIITSNATDDKTIMEIALVDSNGAVVFLSSIKGMSQITIPVKEYKNGLYYLTLTEDGLTDKQQIIINH